MNIWGRGKQTSALRLTLDSASTTPYNLQAEYRLDARKHRWDVESLKEDLCRRLTI